MIYRKYYKGNINNLGNNLHPTAGIKNLILKNTLENYNVLNEKYPEIDTPNLIPIYTPKDIPLYVAAFTSNSGAITDKALELQNYLEQERGKSPFEIIHIFSDSEDPKGINPFFEHYNIKKMTRKNNISLKIRDIDNYYQNLGYENKKDPKLSKKERIEIREYFDKEVIQDMNLLEHKIETIIFDYYWSICTSKIINNYTTINTHLGDLTLSDENNNRILKGFYPVRKAIFLEHNELYATTHLVDEKIDNGDLLLKSKPLKLNLYTDAERINIKLPKGREKEYLQDPENISQLDRLENFYEAIMRNYCDSQILPLSLWLHSEGRFAKDSKGNMYFNGHQYQKAIKIDKD
jgi:folate-dependent phosphoribosylglycinamide formyltransferase PurN